MGFINVYTCSFLQQLDVTTTWLKEQFGQKAFFPNSDNSDFNLTDDVGVSIFSFIVNGLPATQRISTYTPGQSSSRSSNVVSPSVGAITYKPIFSAKKSNSINVKIVQANVTKSATGKLEFHKLGQAFIDVNEATANIYYISAVVQRKWGDEHIIVTGDGLKIEDSSGTQGMLILVSEFLLCSYDIIVITYSLLGFKFWKVGSRKIFAVVESELDRIRKGKGKRKRKEVIQIEDSDDDTSAYLTEKKLKREDELMMEVKSIRHDLGAVLSLSNEMKLPPGLFKQLVDTFKCNICQSTPMNPPVIHSML